MVWKIHSYPKNPRVYKALIAAKYNGIEIEYPQDFKMGVDNKTPEFLKLNPHGKVPTLETEQGGVWESNAIVRFVARSGSKSVYGKNDFEAAQIDAWMDWAQNCLDTPCSTLWLPIWGIFPYNKKAEQEALEKLQKELKVLDAHLTNNTFLVGDRISAADITVVCSLLYAFVMCLEPSFRKPFRAVNRWFMTLIHQPNFAAVLGEVKLCEKKMEPKKAEHPKKEEKPKEEKPKKEEKPEAEEEEKPKPKNALDLLPKSSFVLDEWKRTYSNTDTRTVAMPWLWEHFDPEGYSIYFAEYRYANENKQLFLTCNYVTGFYQRLELLRKYGFGCTLILGTDDNQSVKSCWIFRGSDIPPMMKDCDDCELWDWVKADPSDPAVRERVADFFTWDKPIDGKDILEGKVYK